ncbi:MAG: hypothetical protein IPK50_23675 [Fibrobacterota bacterium]|nr:MAG: hypothetical protein IPK50_23675 [Fibrobacterota bacterium]
MENPSRGQALPPSGRDRNPFWAPPKPSGGLRPAARLPGGVQPPLRKPPATLRRLSLPESRSLVLGSRRPTSPWPFCVTVDFDTVGQGEPEKINTVTIRERDKMTQDRIAIDQVENYLRDRLK